MILSYKLFKICIDGKIPSGFNFQTADATGHSKRSDVFIFAPRSIDFWSRFWCLKLTKIKIKTTMADLHDPRNVYSVESKEFCDPTTLEIDEEVTMSSGFDFLLA